MVADNADDSVDVRHTLRRRGSTPTVPPAARRNRKQPKRGRPLRAGTGSRQRWNGERWFGWMNTCRRLVVRSDRHLRSFRACCLALVH